MLLAPHMLTASLEIELILSQRHDHLHDLGLEPGPLTSACDITIAHLVVTRLCVAAGDGARDLVPLDAGLWSATSKSLSWSACGVIEPCSH